MALAPMRSNNAMSDMAAIMEKARAYSDSRLADVLAGKDVSIPQYVAMTEAMGRKQLRQAVDGAQAQQQAQQPSIKDQLLAEQSAPQAVAGIDQLAAPNMESIDLAGGGIIAFDQGGNVPGFSGLDSSYVNEALGFSENRRPFQVDPELERIRKINEEEEAIRATRKAAVADFFGGKGTAADVRSGKSITKASDAKKTTPSVVAQPATPFTESSFKDFDQAAALFEKERSQAAPAAANPNAPAAPAPGIAGINLSQPTTFERRANPFGEMSAEKVDVEGLKSRGLGEGLMRLSAGLLSAPGAKGVSAGIAGLAEQAGLTRKETNALKKDARDYDLNRARAEAAFEQGQDELGLKYTEAANINRYRMASLAKEPDALRVAREALKDPKLAAIIGKEGKAEMYSVEAATKAFNDILEKNPKYARSLADMGVRDPLSYRQFVINGLSNNVVSATVPEGAKTRS